MALANTSFDQSLWWTPHSRISKILNDGTYLTNPANAKGVEKQADWLLHTLSYFKAPNDKSRKLVTDNASVSVSGKDVPLEPKLRTASVKAAKLLVRESGNWGYTGSGAESVSAASPCLQGASVWYSQ